jgi:hypothetical protein
VYGARGVPPCGVLGPGSGGKTVFVDGLRLPPQLTICWSEGISSYTNKNAVKYTNIVSLSSITNHPRAGEIVFEFTSNKTWTVTHSSPSER